MSQNHAIELQETNKGWGDSYFKRVNSQVHVGLKAIPGQALSPAWAVLKVSSISYRYITQASLSLGLPIHSPGMWYD